MRGAWTIYRRELAGLFFGPLAWILLCVALAFNGYVFTTVLKETGGDVMASLRYASGESVLYWAGMVFLPPLLTMRMISEEARSGLLEFLLTAPVTDAAVIAGKFGAALSFMAIFWLSNLVYAAAIHSMGTPPDWAPVLGGYLGAVLTSGLFCAVGLLMSGLTNTPLLAAFSGFVANLVILLLPQLAGLSSSTWLHESVAIVDVMSHSHRSFLIGRFDTGVVAFFVAWSVFFLFLAARAVEARRWR